MIILAKVCSGFVTTAKAEFGHENQNLTRIKRKAYIVPSKQNFNHNTKLAEKSKKMPCQQLLYNNHIKYDGQLKLKFMSMHMLIEKPTISEIK